MVKWDCMYFVQLTIHQAPWEAPVVSQAGMKEVT
jgi:hypothetical protein